MRCSRVHLLPVLATVIALAVLVPGRALPAPSDANVHGVRGGTQHSPSVAMTPVGGTYVLTFDRVDTTTAVDFVRLAMSPDQSRSFHDVALPALPANWTWRPNAAIAFDPGTNRMWMVGQARSHQSPGAQIGLYVAAGSIGPGGSINWSTPLALYSRSLTSLVLPRVALATGDGTGQAYVLFENAYSSAPGSMTLYRVPADYPTGGIVLADDLAANEAGLYYTTPTLAVAPGGHVMAGWIEYPTTGSPPTAPFVLRTSHDGGATFSPEEVIASISFVPDGPGAVVNLIQMPTLLFAHHASDFPSTRLLFWGARYEPAPFVVDPSDIFFVSDCCSGGPWNAFGSPHDRGFGSFELNPAVTMAEDGYFYMGWHDFAPFDPDSVSQFVVSRLWNMGASSSEPLPFADTSFDWDNVVSNLAGMGWVNGVATLGDRVTFAWGDHRGADPDVYARSFRAGGFAQTQCAGDTVDVVAGGHASFSWRIENHNSLFTDQYQYGASGTRSWAGGFALESIEIGPNGYADVTFGFDVPDTAAAGLMQVFAYAEDHVRTSNCPMFLRIQSLVDVGPGEGPAGAGAVALSAARPNPTVGATSFTFTLPVASEVDLAVYDLRGRRVATLAGAAVEAGAHSARWDAAGAAPGIYFARLSARAGGAVTTRNQRVVVLP